MDETLNGCRNVRFRSFPSEYMSEGRGAIDEGEPVVTDGDPTVYLRYTDLYGDVNGVYIALADVDAVTETLREDIQGTVVFDSVHLTHVSSGFVQTCPVCEEETGTHDCVKIQQWLLPSPVLSVDKTALVHEECCERLAAALNDVWEHTAVGLGESL